MNEEIKSAIEAGLAEVKKKVDAANDNNAEQVKSLDAKIMEVQGKIDAAKESGISAETIQKMQEHLDKLDVKMNKPGKSPIGEQKSFNQYLGEAIEEAAGELKSFAGKKGGSMSIQMKAAGDMNSATNFANGSYGLMTTDYRTANVLQQPDRTVYLRDIIPGGTTDAATITYPVATGQDGAPAPWKEGTTKPIFDFDFSTKTLNVQWIAGIVRVPRAMLDDVKFLQSYLQANMLKALLKAENAQILNGDGNTPNLLGLMPQATPYDGSYTLMLEQIIDAAHGQVADKGFDASHVVLNARDAVKIALNKANGSGEYDLPVGSVGYVNGKLNIAGLNVVTMGSNQLAANNWLTGDFSAAQLITRLSPEIRFFEQNEDDVRKNMITIRIEERVALATYFPEAFVKDANA